MIGIPKKSNLRLLALRGSLSLLLTSAMLPWFGTSALPARADGPECSDPEARVQILIKHVIVFNDGDWHSSGEINMRFSVGQEGLEGCSNLERHLVTSQINFSADDGDVVALDRPIPRSGDALGVGVTETFGLPLYRGARYGVGLDVSESDNLPWCCQYDAPADVILEMNEENGWQIGRHDYRTDYDLSPAVTVGYEVRYVALPDLHPTDIKVLAIPGSTDDLVCMEVENIGPVEAGPFQATLRLNGQAVSNGIAQAGHLGAGQHGDLCVQTRLPTTGLFRLSAVVDEPRGIFEIKERNNDLEQRFIGKASIVPQHDLTIGTASADPSAAAPADLMVEAIRVKGKEPSGQNDCDPGKNDVTAVVKNGGTGAGSAIVVRLIVDGEEDDAQEKTVPSLDAARTTEVVFDDVRLKDGQRTLTIMLDPKKSIAESDEANNVREVMLRCKNED